MTLEEALAKARSYYEWEYQYKTQKLLLDIAEAANRMHKGTNEYWSGIEEALEAFRLGMK